MGAIKIKGLGRDIVRNRWLYFLLISGFEPD
jgi:hypothetical protein